MFQLETGPYCSLAREDQTLHETVFTTVEKALETALDDCGVGHARVIDQDTDEWDFYASRFEMEEYLRRKA